MSKTKIKTKPSQVFTKVKVVGVGGAGGTMIDRLAGLKIPAVEYIAVNTDVQALEALQSPEVEKIRIGESLTKGLGTGMDPQLGRAAIEKDVDKVKSVLKGADMIFIVGGLGGGTGSGAGPVIAKLSKKTKAITVAVVIKPFSFEGAQRMAIAEDALKKFKNRVDALVTISNNQILNLTDKSSTLLKAFGIVDDILITSVSAISDILTVPGLVNVDFSDVRTILAEAGSVLVGVGSARGENRAAKAAQSVFENPLIEDFSIKGAQGVLFIISGPEDLTMCEVNEVAEIVAKELNPDAKIIFGAVIDEYLKDTLKVTLIASNNMTEGGTVARDRKRVTTLPHHQDTFIDKTKKQSPSLSSRATPTEVDQEARDDQEEIVKTYGIDKEELEEKLAEKEREEIQLEEELEIPAFLRKKIK
ncbi:cell division protein FtsZ [Patescibacteria group bacterium AH-259-L07]|nr:cell division protein FtsZ [Patescibacteria group bacterium AH-259-L07]